MPQQDSNHLPPALLQRLLTLSFQDPNTKISTDALGLTNEYLTTFIREAIYRAVDEKKKRLGGEEGGMVEVQDLERLLGQLLLDF